MVALHSDHVRENNRRAVLQLLRSGHPWSRSDLARAAALSFPTVNAIVNEFGAAGLVHDVGQTARGGRPAQLVQLRSGARSVLALDLSRARVRARPVDLLGEAHEPLAGPPVRPGFEPQLRAWLERTLAELSEREAQPSYLAAAVPGVIEPASGRVRLAPALGWHDFALAPWLHEASGLPVVVENDVNAMALAEHHYGAGRQHQHQLFVALGRGVGAALILSGALYRGSGFAAGEIGYSLLPGLPSPPASLSQPGPLEHHLLELSRAFLDAGGHLALNSETARTAFEAFAGELHIILHNLVCLVNPELLTLAFPADPEGRLLAALEARWHGPLPVELRSGTLGEDAALRGAAHLALLALEQDLCTSPKPHPRGAP